MNIAEKSKMSLEFIQLQNKIAQTFKRLMMSIHEQCGHDDVFFARVVLGLYRQHHKQTDKYDEALMDYVLRCGELRSRNILRVREKANVKSIYRTIMIVLVLMDFDYELEGLRREGFDYDSLTAAFAEYTDRAFRQFAKGKHVENKIIRQLKIIQITEEYKQYDIKLTLRQLYYQMVSKKEIKNHKNEYKNLISITGGMRENNVLELDEFADNTRFAYRYTYAEGVQQYIQSQLDPNAYFLDSREGQPVYLEVWIEKEAVRSVFKPVTDRHDVPLFIARGYPSTSSLCEQANKILSHLRENEYITEVKILYFGDHDPSGKQIPEAIENILRNDYQFKHVEVRACALNMDQIDEFNLPPDPMKMDDPRAIGYIETYGTDAWEIDALPPLELQRIIVENIEEYTDQELLNRVLTRQRKHREKIERIRKIAMEEAADE